MHVMVPDGYPAVEQSKLGQELHELLGFLHNVDSRSAVAAVAPRFLALLSRHDTALRAVYRITEDDRHRWDSLDSYHSWERSSRFSPAESLEDGQRLAGIYPGQMHPAVISALTDSGLAYRAEGGGTDGDPARRWVVLRRALADAYDSMLANAYAGPAGLQPATERLSVFTVTGEWTTDGIAEWLTGAQGAAPPADPDGLADAIGVLTLKLVVPACPLRADQIAQVRERYGGQFDAFAAEVDAAAEAVAALNVQDPAFLDDYMREEIERRFLLPTRELRRELDGLGIESAFAAINVKTGLPAGLVLAGGAAVAGHPVVAGTAAAALGLVGIRRGLREKRSALRKQQPSAAYLMRIQDDFTPSTLLGRIRAACRRVALGPDD